MRTSVDTNEEDSHMRPRKPQQVQLEFVHVCGLAIKQQQQSEHRRLGTSLPAIYWVMGRRFGVLLEMQFLDLLPASHDAGASSETNIAPLVVKIAMVHRTDIIGLAGERGKIIATSRMVVVCHRVNKSADDGLGNIWQEINLLPLEV